MGGDLCWRCDGTGEREFLSGAPCYECNGSGWLEYPDDEPYDDFDDDDEQEQATQKGPNQ